MSKIVMECKKKVGKKILFNPLEEVTRLRAEEYKDALCRVASSGWYLLGHEVETFEQHYAKYIGTSYCVAVGSGLDALKLILRGYKELGILADGDEIIVPANTYIATILAITDNQLTPILVEPSINTLELDATEVVKKLTSRTKAIMTVHLYGRVAYNTQLREICKQRGLLLIEDCAQSHGCEWEGIKTGTLGNAGAHSFYPTKNLGAMGDAGAITTSNKDLADIVRSLANYGSARKYEFRYTGINSRMSEMDAAVLNVKLRYLDTDNDHRRKIAEIYNKVINHPSIQLPQEMPEGSNVYHLYPILCTNRDALQTYLAQQEIQTQIHYPIPPHKQACYSQWNKLSFPITEQIARQELSLPIHAAMELADAYKVADAINAFVLQK